MPRIKASRKDVKIKIATNFLLPNLESLEVTPTKEVQTLKPKSGYVGFDKVVVNEISNKYIEPNGTLDIKANGEYDVKNYEKAKVDVGGITKGLVINAVDNNGYVTDASIVGMTKIPEWYFGSYSASYKHGLNRFLTTLNIPNNVTYIGDYAFYYAQSLALTKLPDELTYLGYRAFAYCPKLAIKSVPIGVSEIPEYCFRNCSEVTEMTCYGNISSIGAYAFNNTKIAKFVMPNITSVPTLLNTNAFSVTPIYSGTGYIYVPDNLVEDFKVASNWSTFANVIKGVSEL